MSETATVVALVEGATERYFVRELLAPYLGEKGIWITAVILSKPGAKGGDVRFARAQKDIRNLLRQRSDTWVTLMIDYYGIGTDWPGYAESKRQADSAAKASVMNGATAREVQTLFADRDPDRRFIPYVSMHETEALYFSDPAILAAELGVAREGIDAILGECREPEGINDRPDGAPSKRLKALSPTFKKTVTGIGIAKAVGIDAMRRACPLFDAWVTSLEGLAGRAR